MKCEHTWTHWLVVDWCTTCGVLKINNIITIPKNSKWKIIVDAADGYIVVPQKLINIKDVRDAQPDRTSRG